MVGFVASSPHPALAVVVRVGPCAIEAPAALESQARALGERAEGILPRLERRLGVSPSGAFRVLLVPSDPHAESEFARLDAMAPQWAAGYMLSQSRIGGIRVARAQQYPYGTIESVFAHEVTHLLIHDAVGDRVPRWFNEGVATQEGRRWGVQDVVLHTSTLLTTSLPSLEDLNVAFRGGESGARTAYAASFAFVAWAETRYGPQFIGDVLRETRTIPFASAWDRAAGTSLAASEREWRGETLLRYRWVPIVAAASMLWVFVGLLVFVGAVRKRAKARAVRERWAERERLEDAGTDPRDRTRL